MTWDFKGEIAETHFEMACLRKGMIVSTPRTAARYDKIVDSNGKLYRVQVKYCDSKSKTGANAYNLGLRTKRHKKTVKESYSASEIDALVVYLPHTEKLYWFPPEVFAGKSSLQLRVGPPKKNFKYLDINQYLFT